MSGNQAYYYDPSTGLPFLIPVPHNRVPPPHPPPSSLGGPQTPEAAPLGSFQNPYPANSIPTHTLPPTISTSTLTTHCAPALTSLYRLPHQSQTAEIPIQYFQPTPLLCQCDAFSGQKDGATASTSTQDHGHVSSSWWPSPPVPASSEARRQQTAMLCTRCGQTAAFHAAPPPEPPMTPLSQTPTPSIPTTNPTLSPPRLHVTPQPQPRLLPSTYPKPTRSTAPKPPSPRQASTAFVGLQDQIRDLDELEVRRWADCHVCNEKPALREKEGVLFCLGCWAEAERAERERAW